VEGEALDKARRIELHVLVDGKPLVRMQAREPGLLAFVSKPNEQGFDIEVVQPDKVRFTDERTHTGMMTEPVEKWQLRALGFDA
jgi:hypothetical protein